MEDFDERVAYCALNRIFGSEPGIAHSILETLGTARAVFGLPEDRLNEIFGPFSKYRQLINADTLERSRKELSALREDGFEFITLADSCYPAELKECPDAPVGLYIRSGSLPEQIFNRRPCIAVVGTRDVSAYGREWCARLVQALADAAVRPLIVSGLALGVDIAAHTAALRCGLPTIGVMATGVDRVYPARHTDAARRIAGSDGSALITDYPPGTRPESVNFIRRNRIIAGMCTATVLVESKFRGGGLITANQAFGYGREVFALPGRIDDVRSEGCNDLIRKKIAEPIGNLDEFVRDAGLGVLNRRNREVLREEVDRLFGKRLDAGSLEELQLTAATIKKHRGISVEELCDECGVDYARACVYAGMLEAEGIISRDLFQRCSIIFKNV